MKEALGRRNRSQELMLVNYPASIRFSLLLLAPALALSACQQSSQPGTPKEDGAPAGPEAKPGLEASGGILVLPAVAGRPGAAYFTLANGGEKAAELAAVHVEGALRAEMHETGSGGMARLDKVTIAPGATVEFARGAKHVMAFELDDSLKTGETTEMTLTFADGDKLSLPLKMETMGAAAHGDHH